MFAYHIRGLIYKIPPRHSEFTAVHSRSSPTSQPASPVAMPRGTTWSVGRPVLRAATASARRASRWNLSTRSGDERQATAAATAAVQGAEPKAPRLTNRLRRLARAYPEEVAAISPAAVEESRAKYSAGAPNSEVSNISRQLSCNVV